MALASAAKGEVVGRAGRNVGSTAPSALLDGCLVSVSRFTLANSSPGAEQCDGMWAELCLADQRQRKRLKHEVTELAKHMSGYQAVRVVMKGDRKVGLRAATMRRVALAAQCRGAVFRVQRR